MPVWIIWLNITCHKSVVLPFRLCLFRCKRNLENILHHGACLGWPENSVKWKMIFVDRKISSLKRERERERENLRPEPHCRLKPAVFWSLPPPETCCRRPLDRTLVILILSPPEACHRLTDLVISISLPMTDLVVSILSPMTHDRSLSFPQFSISLFLPLLVWPNFLV